MWQRTYIFVRDNLVSIAIGTIVGQALLVAFRWLVKGLAEDRVFSGLNAWLDSHWSAGFALWAVWSVLFSAAFVIAWRLGGKYSTGAGGRSATQNIPITVSKIDHWEWAARAFNIEGEPDEELFTLGPVYISNLSGSRSLTLDLTLATRDRNGAEVTHSGAGYNISRIRKLGRDDLGTRIRGPDHGPYLLSPLALTPGQTVHGVLAFIRTASTHMGDAKAPIPGALNLTLVIKDVAAEATVQLPIPNNGYRAGAVLKEARSGAPANELASGTLADVIKAAEQGTWTPSLVGTDGLEITKRHGRYTSLGRVHNVEGEIEFTPKSADSIPRKLRISGLPFRVGGGRKKVTADLRSGLNKAPLAIPGALDTATIVFQIDTPLSVETTYLLSFQADYDGA